MAIIELELRRKVTYVHRKLNNYKKIKLHESTHYINEKRIVEVSAKTEKAILSSSKDGVAVFAGINNYKPLQLSFGRGMKYSIHDAVIDRDKIRCHGIIIIDKYCNFK